MDGTFIFDARKSRYHCLQTNTCRRIFICVLANQVLSPVLLWVGFKYICKALLNSRHGSVGNWLTGSVCELNPNHSEVEVAGKCLLTQG